MKKIIRLTEDDLTRLVKRVINENEESDIKIGDKVKLFISDDETSKIIETNWGKIANSLNMNLSQLIILVRYNDITGKVRERSPFLTCGTDSVLISLDSNPYLDRNSEICVPKRYLKKVENSVSQDVVSQEMTTKQQFEEELDDVLMDYPNEENSIYSLLIAGIYNFKKGKDDDANKRNQKLSDIEKRLYNKR